MIRRLFPAIGLVSLGLICAGPLAGQAGTGAVRGVFRDAATDSVVVGGTIIVLGTQLSATTNAKGEYRIIGLVAGRYSLRAVAIGYQSALRDAVDISSAQTAEVNFRLTPAIVDIPGIVVTAAGSAQKAAESSVSIAVLDREEISRRNVVTVQDALPFVPGVVLNNGDIDIRGASGISGGVGSRVLMLLDGHPVLSGDGGEVFWEALPLMDLERAEVVKGSYSALYGSAALGGVINMITSPIAERPQTRVKLQYGGYGVPKEYQFTNEHLNLGGLNLQHSRQVGEVGVRLAAGYNASDGYQQNGNYNRWLTRAKVTSAPGSSHPWDAYALWSRNDVGEHFVWRSQDQPYEVDPSVLGDWERDEQMLFGGSIVALASSKSLLRINPYVTHSAVRNHFAADTAGGADWHQATRFGANALLSMNPGSGHSISTGLDAAGTAVTSNFLGSPFIVDVAPYAQDEVRLADRVRLSLGARLDYHKADMGESEVTPSPKLGLVFAPTERVSLRTSIGRGYRAPSAIEQFVSTTKQGFRVIPNPALHGETAWSGEFGATASFGPVWFDGAVFQSEYHGLIAPAAAPAPDFGAFQFQNVNRARVRGADLATRLGVARDLLSFQLTYLYLDTRDLDTQLELPYRSRHNFTGTMDAFSGHLGVDLRYRSRVDQVLAYPLDPRQDITNTHGITLVDLRASYRILGTAFLAKVSNVLQEKYVDVMERNQGAPRSLLISAVRDF